MKRRAMFICAALAFALVIALSAAFNGDEEISYTEPALAAVSYPEKKPEYSVYCSDGRVMIEYCGEKVETGIIAENLRTYDRQLLEKGISVSSYKEVLMLLEDFNS